MNKQERLQKILKIAYKLYWSMSPDGKQSPSLRIQRYSQMVIKQVHAGDVSAALRLLLVFNGAVKTEKAK